MIMIRDLSVTRGQRFRDAQLAMFGRPGAEWVVQDVFLGTDRLWYARVVLASDPTRIKTLSAAVLEDRHRFISA